MTSEARLVNKDDFVALCEDPNLIMIIESSDLFEWIIDVFEWDIVLLI